MKDFWNPIQMTIKDFCATFDNKWQIRKRIIDTHLLVLFIFKLILSKIYLVQKTFSKNTWKKLDIQLRILVIRFVSFMFTNTELIFMTTLQLAIIWIWTSHPRICPCQTLNRSILKDIGFYRIFLDTEIPLHRMPLVEKSSNHFAILPCCRNGIR